MQDIVYNGYNKKSTLLSSLTYASLIANNGELSEHANLSVMKSRIPRQ